jgi:hypothetical protein
MGEFWFPMSEFSGLMSEFPRLMSEFGVFMSEFKNQSPSAITLHSFTILKSRFFSYNMKKNGFLFTLNSS